MYVCLGQERKLNFGLSVLLVYNRNNNKRTVGLLLSACHRHLDFNQDADMLPLRDNGYLTPYKQSW